MYFSHKQNPSTFDQLTLALKAFYGAIFALALIGALSALLLACFSVVKIRLVLYFACSFLLFLAFISTTLLIIVGALVPNLSQICGYIDGKIATGAGAADLLDKWGAP
jgi:hypothetical protein